MSIKYDKKVLSEKEFDTICENFLKTFTENSKNNYCRFYQFCSKLEEGALILSYLMSKDNFVPVGYCIPSDKIWIFPKSYRKEKLEKKRCSNIRIFPKSELGFNIDQEGNEGALWNHNKYEIKYVPEDQLSTLREFNEKYFKPYLKFEKYLNTIPKHVFEIFQRDIEMEEDNIEQILEPVLSKLV